MNVHNPYKAPETQAIKHAELLYAKNSGHNGIFTQLSITGLTLGHTITQVGLQVFGDDKVKPSQIEIPDISVSVLSASVGVIIALGLISSKLTKHHDELLTHSSTTSSADKILKSTSFSTRILIGGGVLASIGLAAGHYINQLDASILEGKFDTYTLGFASSVLIMGGLFCANIEKHLKAHKIDPASITAQTDNVRC